MYNGYTKGRKYLMKPINSYNQTCNKEVDAAEEKHTQKHFGTMLWVGYIAAPLLLMYVIPVIKQLLLRNGNIEFLFVIGRDLTLRNLYLAANEIMSVCWALILIGTILVLLKYSKEDQAKVSRVLMIEALVILVLEYLIRLTPAYGYMFIYNPIDMTLPTIATVSYIVVWMFVRQRREGIGAR